MHILRILRAGAVGVATAAASVVLVASAGASPVYPNKIYGRPGTGCPSGAVCVYPNSDDFRTGPEAQGKYYTYGPHDLHHQTGVHLVYNNQYPVDGVAAGASFCLGYHGRGGELNGGLTTPGQWAPIYLTPVNSIDLWLYEDQYLGDLGCTL